MAASQNGHVKIVEKLLDCGANANLQNEVCYIVTAYHPSQLTAVMQSSTSPH